MKFSGCFIFLCWILTAGGVPLTHNGVHSCLYRFNQVMEELNTSQAITSEPRYIPLCESDWVKWEPVQCTDIGGPSCFCVDPNTGLPREETRIDPFSSEEIKCDSRPCQNTRIQYRIFLLLNPSVADAPFGYMPSCQTDGRFEAMQRHAFHFFCVDTETGEKVSDTDYLPGTGKPITEKICQEYSNLWRRYKVWLEENDLEQELNEQYVASTPDKTCPDGFEFHSCNCKNLCTPGTNMSIVLEDCDNCKPVCRCPKGFYEYKKTCISSNECMKKPQEPFIMDIKETLWNTYMLLNSNNILKRHWEAEDDTITTQQPYDTTAQQDETTAETQLDEKENTKAVTLTTEVVPSRPISAESQRIGHVTLTHIDTPLKKASTK